MSQNSAENTEDKPECGYIIADTVSGSISLMKKEVLETRYEKVE